MSHCQPLCKRSSGSRLLAEPHATLRSHFNCRFAVCKNWSRSVGINHVSMFLAIYTVYLMDIKTNCGNISLMTVNDSWLAVRTRGGGASVGDKVVFVWLKTTKCPVWFKLVQHYTWSICGWSLESENAVFRDNARTNVWALPVMYFMERCSLENLYILYPHCRLQPIWVL